MDRIDPLNATVVGEPYRNANSDTGDEGSYPDARAFDAMMTEIVEAIAALGVVPDDADWTQLGQAIVLYVAAHSFAPTLLADIVVGTTGSLTKSLKNVNHSAAFNFAATDRAKRHRFDTVGVVGTLLAAAAAGDGWNVKLLAVEANCSITSPAANIYVNGDAAAVATYTFVDGESGELICNGANYFLSTNRAPAQLRDGYFQTLVDDGVIASGTYTPTIVGGAIRGITPNGAFNFNPPADAGSFTMIIKLTNGATASTITWGSGFTKLDVAAYNTTAGNVFLLYIVKAGATVNGTLVAQQ